MPCTSVNREREPHPPATYTVNGATRTLRGPPLANPSKGTGRAPPPPPPPHDKRTIALATRTVNAILLKSACHLASYSGPPPPIGRPISLQDPLHPLLQALSKADEAYDYALAWQRFELVAKAQLFRGHAYRAIGLWDLAYDAYVRAARHPGFAGDRSEEGLEALTRYCAEMRDGKKPSGRVGGMKDGERKREVKGLFRCGTFGNLRGMDESDDAGTGSQEDRKREQEQEELEKQIREELGVVEDGGKDKNAIKGFDDRRDEGQGGGDGQVDGDDESEIDWIAIGASDPDIDDRPKPLRRPGYPPLRSARGRFVTQRKMWTSP